MKFVNVTLVLSIFLLINLNLYSFELEERRILSETESEIVRVFEDQETSKVVRVFSRFDENNIFHQGLLFEDGDRLPFEVNERVIEILDNKILVKKQLNRADEEISIYEYNRKKLKKIKSMKIGLYNPFHMLKNGNFFYSDYAEGFAWTFALFSNNLDLIRTYKPFESGYSTSSYSDYNSYIFVGVEPDNLIKDNRIKLYQLDSNNGEILNEIAIDINPDIKYIGHFKAFDDILIIYSLGKLTAVDHSGNKIWQRNISWIKYNLSNLYIDNKCLLVFTREDIVCIDISNGNTLWERKLKVYNNENDSNILPANIPIFTSSDHRLISFVIGNYKLIGDNKRRIWDKFFLINLDFEGNLLDKKELIKDSNVFNIIEDHDRIKLLTDKEVLHYEK